MKKYHLLVLTALCLAYGWLYYQKNHSGPDIYNWFRAKSNHDSFSDLVFSPHKVLGQSVVFYGVLNDAYISAWEYIDPIYEKPVYLNKNRLTVSYDCLPEHIIAKGTVSQHQGYYYFESITEITGFQSDRNKPNFGAAVVCQLVE